MEDEYQCWFYSNDSDVVTMATWVNSTCIKCDSEINTVGDLSLQILYKGVSYTTFPGTLSIYGKRSALHELKIDCTSNTCGTCMGDLKPACEWCLQDQQCTVKNGTCSSSLEQCPSNKKKTKGFLSFLSIVFDFSQFWVYLWRNWCVALFKLCNSSHLQLFLQFWREFRSWNSNKLNYHSLHLSTWFPWEHLHFSLL